MLILGVVVLIGALSLMLYGNYLNTSFAVQINSAFSDGKVDTGTIWVIIGIVIAVVAVAAIVFAVIKKKYFKF